MAEIDLLKSLPKTKRNIASRSEAKTSEHIRISKQFGEMYFDGPREFGYGGYVYDGRWATVAQDIINHFGLKPGSRVLDVGCAKGFLVKELFLLGIDTFGLDISEYALRKCEPEVIGRLHLGSADSLPFPDNSFDVTLSINTLHNLPEKRLIRALQEITRVSPNASFVQVDSYLNETDKKVFESWVLTAEYHDYPANWIKLFEKAGYSGDWFWTKL
tara:strand:- start:3234 stop:3881 length:648 start_codon:yes stop_codon:yes gene_type:complete